MGLACSPTVQHDLVAGLELRVRGVLDYAREIDPGYHREATYDGRRAGQREPVFVVEGRVRHAHGDVALHQIVLVELLDVDALTALAFLDHHRLERSHSSLTRLHLGCKLAYIST